MTQEFAVSVGRETLELIMLVSAPTIGLALVVGILVSLFQATTQIHEQTLTFAPKIVAVFVGLLVFGPWMLNSIAEFTIRLIGNIPGSIR
ncbi:MAG: flagellar biosynthesis protein FliQ [Firmicutes bacterium]|nr:flagellar biosynthesis protein FliQ [Bacillota bacterium]